MAPRPRRVTIAPAPELDPSSPGRGQPLRTLSLRCNWPSRAPDRRRAARLAARALAAGDLVAYDRYIATLAPPARARAMAEVYELAPLGESILKALDLLDLIG